MTGLEGGLTSPGGATVVAIVAPSGYAPEPQALSRARSCLSTAGCEIRDFHDPVERYQRFGATDAQRAAQLHAAASDPDVQIVLALRGGYGMSRILHLLDLDLLSRSGKLFVGHSDFTALHMALLARQGSISFAGPMLCNDFTREDASAFTHGNFWQCLQGPGYQVAFHADGNPEADVCGVLWGGNLTMLAHLVGSPYMPRVEDGILFIEDVNEHPYRVERMLLQLLHAGLLNQKAIVFGDFSAYRLADYDNGYDFDAMLAYLRQRLPVPVFSGLPFGHIRDKVTLPVGSRARLISHRGRCELSMHGYPCLPLTGS